MCEGPSRITGPILPDPSLFPHHSTRPSSARGRLEGNGSGLLRGPMAPDPVLHPGCYSARSTPPRRITTGSAAIILERGQMGEVRNLLTFNGVPLNPSPVKPKPVERDFGKENVRKLREVQRRFRELEAQREHTKPLPVKALWTSSKYQDVPSRVMGHLQESTPTTKTACQNFLKSHSLSGRPQRRRSESHPDAGDLEQMEVRGHSVDFVSHNARAAGRTLRKSQSLTNLRPDPPPSATKGKVPHYLQQRKIQWKREEEERKRNIPDPSIPAGHTLMSERERQETLESLKEKHSSLVGEMVGLQLKGDTFSIRSRRTELDQRLSEVEEAVKIFSRDKVYVKLDT